MKIFCSYISSHFVRVLKIACQASPGGLVNKIQKERR